MKLLYSVALLALVACRDKENPIFFQIVDNDRIGFMDAKGTVVIPAVFKNAGNFSEGLAAARGDGDYGYIDASGSFVIPPQFDFALEFKDGIAVVAVDGKPFCIDDKGNKLFDHPFTAIQVLKDGRARVTTASAKQGIISSNGKLLIDTVYKEVELTPYNTYIVEGLNHDYQTAHKKERSFEKGLIDYNGKFIIPFGKYQNIAEYQSGYAEIEIPSDYEDTTGNSAVTGFLDSTGKLIFSRDKRDDINIYGPAAEGLVSFYTNEGTSRYGVMDFQGKTVINEPWINTIQEIKDGRIFVRDTIGNYILLNKKGERVSKQLFDETWGFQDGVAVIEEDGKWGAIDTNGRYVIPPKFQGIWSTNLTNDHFVFYEQREKMLYGVANKKGEIVLPARFSRVDFSGFRDGLLQVVEDERMGYVDKKGKYVWRQAASKNSLRDTLNIDYMLRGYFIAASRPEKDTYSNGWATASNTPVKISADKQFQSGKLTVEVRTADTSTWLGLYPGVRLYVVNSTSDAIRFEAQDSRLDIKMQAIDKTGTWRDIEYLPNSWCGNSYHEIELLSGYYFSFSMPVYKGSVKTKLRAELKYLDPRTGKEAIIYSNEFKGSVNPGQFWRKLEYMPSGIMDPYNE